jgi:hypothetical protein
MRRKLASNRSRQTLVRTCDCSLGENLDTSTTGATLTEPQTTIGRPQKILCVTHTIAGPSAGRTSTEHDASVLKVMYTHGLEHNFVYTYANLGCASARLNFNNSSDRKQLWPLIREADVWIDSYRNGAMSSSDSRTTNCCWQTRA